jgi:hypothetical protein
VKYRTPQVYTTPSATSPLAGEGKVRVTADRERADRTMVNAKIGAS